MRNKILNFALVFCLIIPCMFMLSACAHEHTFEETWSYNETHHWHASTCEHSDEVADMAEHVDDNHDDVCDVCKYGQTTLVGDTSYASLEAAIQAAGDDDVVTLTEDIDLETALTINKKVTLDLNGKTLTVTNDTAGDGVFMVVAGGDLTINGEGVVNGVGNNDWNIVVFANGGNVTINGGTYTNIGATDVAHNDADHFDVIYVKNGGHATINGGTFYGQTPKWILNSHDTLTGTFDVKGGTFHGFDPSNADTEPGGLVNFVNESYKVQQSGYTYRVIKKVSIWTGAVEDVPAVQDGVIKIETAGQLAGLAKEVNEGNTFENVNIELLADINLANIEWTPIGFGSSNFIGQILASEGALFKGNFDGNNNTVRNLKITTFNRGGKGSGASAAVALFGNIYRAEIKNLTVEDAEVQGNHRVGAIVGYSIDSDIINCHVEDVDVNCIYANDDESGDKAGALVGFFAKGNKYDSSALISNCSAEDCEVKADRDAGQVIGTLWNGAIYENVTAEDVEVECNNSSSHVPDYVGSGDNITNGIIGRTNS